MVAPTQVIEIRHIRAFLAVAQHESFTRAARELAVSQPALTITIRQLEAAIGLPLLTRTTRRVTLTEIGSEFLASSSSLINNFDYTISNIIRKHRENRRISIGSLVSSSNYFISPISANFSRIFDNISIEILCGTSKTILKYVKEGEVNIGIVAELSGSYDLNVEKLYSDPFVLVAKIDHPLMTKSGSVYWQDIRGHQFLDSGYNEDCIRGVLSHHPELLGTLTAGRYRTNRISTVLSMVEEGIGVAATPLMALPKDLPKNVTYRLLKEPKMKRDMFIISRKSYKYSDIEIKFIEDIKSLISEFFKKNLFSK